jgi:hypothetical protein
MMGPVAVLALAVLAGGCYSFRGGSAPAHLRTVAIPQVEDVSGFGRGTIRQDMTQVLVRKFRDDNSLRVADPTASDSQLQVAITTIRTNERLNISGAELETVRGVIIEARATFNDNTKRREIYKDRTFVGRSQYNIASGTAGENNAIREAIEKVTDDILIATVADW